MNFNPKVEARFAPSLTATTNPQKQEGSLPAPAFPEVPALQAVEEASGMHTYAAKAVEAYPGLQDLEEDKDLLHELIQKPTELHFYWSFGKKIEQYPVKIGGEK